jgi:hypothetical protein
MAGRQIIRAPRPGGTRPWLPVVGWVLAASLSGCGGGGGGGGGGATPTPPPAPAFALVGSLPADAASGVARDAAITVTFNAALDAASVGAAQVTLTGPGNNLIPATVAVNGAAVEIKPKAGALPADTTYTLSLAAAIKDSTGRSLSQATTRTFSTASAQWSAQAGDLAPRQDNVGGTRPIVYTDAAGRTTAAWLDRTGSGEDVIYAARLDRISGNWGEPTVIAQPSQTTYSGLGLAEGPGGDVFLTWTYQPPGGVRSGIQLSRYSVSSSRWLAPEDVNVSPVDGYGVGQVQPVSDAAGNLMLLHSNGQFLYATRRDAVTGAWTPPRRIEYPRPSNYIFKVRAATDAQGSVVAAWMQFDAEDQRAIYAARYDVVTGQWAAAQRVVTVPSSGPEPVALVVDRTGVATLAWVASGGIAGTTTLWASRLGPQDTAWRDAIRLDRPADGVAAEAVFLVVDGAGTVTAMWSQGVAGLRTARWARGASGWSDYATLAQDGVAANAAADCLLVDAAGNLLVVGAISQQIYATRQLATTSRWQPPVLISTPSTGTGVFVNPPAVSMDGAGNAVVLWFAQNLPDQRRAVSFNRLR